MVYRLVKISIFFIFCSNLASEKFSLISTLPNGKLLTNDSIDDIHVIYDIKKHDPILLNELEKLPVTIHFHYDQFSLERCMHIAQTVCKQKQVLLDIDTDHSQNASIRYSCGKNLRVSLITSLYKADEFVVDFMKNMVEQSIFSSTELIIINAHSPGNEEHEILRYLRDYPNIIYIRLPYDPGLYAIWNMGVRYAHAPLIGNANLDDRRDLYSLEEQVKILEEHPEYDLAYCDFCITQKPNDQWYEMFNFPRTNIQQFSKKAIEYCLPGPQPVWRRSMHEKYGPFREDFVSSADQEMWCRAVDKGSQFIKVNCISGVYYLNPKGISTEVNSPRAQQRALENSYIWCLYHHLWS